MKLLHTPCVGRIAAALACAAAFSGCLGAPPEFFESGGERLAYRVLGAGPPLVLVHGFMGSGPVHWGASGTAARLAENFEVIVVDCRGPGRSGKPVDAEAYGLEMVEDVRRLMDHLGLEKAGLAGYSMGAWISLKFAATYPDRVTALAAGGGGYNTFQDKQLGQILNRSSSRNLSPDRDSSL